MSYSNDTNTREVSIVKKITTMSSEEYFSITLKSPEESVDSLLKKAMVATNSDIFTNKIKPAVGI